MNFVACHECGAGRVAVAVMDLGFVFSSCRNVLCGSCGFLQPGESALWNVDGVLYSGELPHYVSWTKVLLELFFTLVHS